MGERLLRFGGGGFVAILMGKYSTRYSAAPGLWHLRPFSLNPQPHDIVSLILEQTKVGS